MNCLWGTGVAVLTPLDNLSGLGSWRKDPVKWLWGNRYCGVLVPLLTPVGNLSGLGNWRKDPVRWLWGPLRNLLGLGRCRRDPADSVTWLWLTGVTVLRCAGCALQCQGRRRDSADSVTWRWQTGVTVCWLCAAMSGLEGRSSWFSNLAVQTGVTVLRCAGCVLSGLEERSIWLNNLADSCHGALAVGRNVRAEWLEPRASKPGGCERQGVTVLVVTRLEGLASASLGNLSELRGWRRAPADPSKLKAHTLYTQAHLCQLMGMTGGGGGGDDGGMGWGGGGWRDFSCSLCDTPPPPPSPAPLPSPLSLHIIKGVKRTVIDFICSRSACPSFGADNKSLFGADELTLW